MGTRAAPPGPPVGPTDWGSREAKPPGVVVEGPRVGSPVRGPGQAKSRASAPHEGAAFVGPRAGAERKVGQSPL